MRFLVTISYFLTVKPNERTNDGTDDQIPLWHAITFYFVVFFSLFLLLILLFHVESIRRNKTKQVDLLSIGIVYAIECQIAFSAKLYNYRNGLVIYVIIILNIKTDDFFIWLRMFICLTCFHLFLLFRCFVFIRELCFCSPPLSWLNCLKCSMVKKECSGCVSKY